MTLLEARVDQSAVLVVPFALTSIMALGGALLPWLLACGTLVLGLPQSIDGLAETVVEFKATHVMAPQRFARRLADRLEMHRHEAMFLIAGADRPVDTAMPRGLKIVDLSAIGEFALIARKRIDHSQRQPLPIGVVGSPSETDFAPLLVETRVKAVPQRAGDAARGAAATGEATLRGPMVPEFIWGAGGRPQALGHVDDWMASGASVQVVSVQPPMFELRGPSGDSAGARRRSRCAQSRRSLRCGRLFRGNRGGARGCAQDAGPGLYGPLDRAVGNRSRHAQRHGVAACNDAQRRLKAVTASGIQIVLHSTS
jgi:hypothetical protein